MSDGLFVPFNAKFGRPPKYTPRELLTKFQEYIEDREGRPIIVKKETSGFSGSNDTGSTTTEPIPQLLSITDFCVHLGTSLRWWGELPEDFSVVKDYIRAYIETYQLKGASAGIFNANIVARLLGLADKREVSAGDGIQIVVNSKAEKEKIEKIGDLGI